MASSAVAAVAEESRPYKLVLIGDSGVGKSALLCRFADDNFPDSYISTIGVDFRFRTLTVDGQIVKLQIWDTAGQERFRTITAAYYRAADGIVLVYDVTNLMSFRHVEDWLAEVELHAAPNVRKLIVGNKADLESERKVTEDMVQKFAESRSVLWLETSAKTSTNVDNAFATLADEVVKERRMAELKSRTGAKESKGGGATTRGGKGRGGGDLGLGSSECMCAEGHCRCEDKCAATGCRQPRRMHHERGINNHVFTERCACVIL